MEHLGDHATFLYIDIKITNGKFIYKFFDERDQFLFFIVRISHLLSNIPFSIFYGSILSEFLRIARCTLKLDDFLIRGKELFVRMLNQSGNYNLTNKKNKESCF